jgi:predicted RNA-binding protein with PUA-like domain
MSYWLMKSEPATFSIDDLRACPGQRTHWDGVRNYQARNFMRERMKRGDLAFFYHSSCAEPGIVGVVEIVREGHPDHTAFDVDDKHFDPKSDPAKPRWYMVDVQLQRKFKRPIALAELRKHSTGALERLALLRRGNRLSITPVAAAEWRFILDLQS